MKGVGKTGEVFPWAESRLHPAGEPLRTEGFSRSEATTMGQVLVENGEFLISNISKDSGVIPEFFAF